TGPALPDSVAYGAFVQSERGLEVLGGSDGQKLYRQCWILDQGLRKWTPSGILPENSVYGTAEVLRSTLYLLAGSSDAKDLSRTTDGVLARDGARDTSGNSEWKRLPPIPGGSRILHASAVARERLFVFGGCRNTANGDLINLSDTYSYDRQARRWKR